MTQALTQLQNDEKEFAQAVYDFAVREITPLRQKMDTEAQMHPPLIKQLFEMGVMGIGIPEEHSGLGSSFMMACLAVEELGRVDASVSVMVDVQNTLVANAILKWGTNEQKKLYLPQLASQKVGAYALSESSSGSDAFALKLKADKKTNDYILNGHKLWITNAAEADIFLVFANANPPAGHKGISCFIVERGYEGFKVGKKEDKLGIRSSSTCELLFKDCHVPAPQLLGPEGKGYKVAIETLNEGRIGIGAQMLGIAQGAYDETLKYIQQREQFGRSISAFQGVQFQLAQMRTWLEAARLMVYNAARIKDSGQDFSQQAAMAKLYASQMAEKICSLAVDLFGGNGFSKEYAIEKFYRDAKIGQIYEGTSNMQLQTIAKHELR